MDETIPGGLEAASELSERYRATGLEVPEHLLERHGRSLNELVEKISACPKAWETETHGTFCPLISAPSEGVALRSRARTAPREEEYGEVSAEELF